MKNLVPYSTDVGLLILRIATGSLMFFHGTGKMSDFLHGKDDFYDPFGIGGVASLALVVFAEFFCSLFLVLGLWTRFILTPLIICMNVAFFIYHKQDELLEKELPLLYLNFVALFVMGPGRYALGRKSTPPVS